MAVAYVSVGSNIEPQSNVREAARLLAEKEAVTAVSTVYLTEAIGRADQPQFYNCVVKLETHLPPRLLRDELKGIEHQLGRRRGQDKCAPRTIDLDLIAYDELVLDEEDLHLPAPQIAERPFLMACLRELGADTRLSGLPSEAGGTPAGGMKAMPEYTELLRRIVGGG